MLRAKLFLAVKVRALHLLLLNLIEVAPLEVRVVFDVLHAFETEPILWVWISQSFYQVFELRILDLSPVHIVLLDFFVNYSVVLSEEHLSTAGHLEDDAA